MPQRRRSPIDAAEDAASALRHDFLECRGYGHMFRPSHVERDPERDGWIQTMLCRGCGTERDRYVSSSGYLSRGARYRYPEGFLVQEISLVDRAGRAAVRRALFA